MGWVKTVWSPSDLVNDDPVFIKAVRLNVGIQHYTFYEDNKERLEEFKAAYFGAPGSTGVLRELIVQCRDRNRVRRLGEIGSADADSAIGTAILSGEASASTIFYNTPVSYTATCPAGQTGNPVTISIPAGQYSSALSVADATAQAMEAATAQAQQALSCVSAGVFQSRAVTSTATCPAASGTTPAATGNSVTVNLPAGTYQSTVSEDVATAFAQQQADAQAQSQLSCVYHNAPQSATVTCADGSHQTATVPANQSQFDADSQLKADGSAYQAAQAAATAQCPTSPSYFTVGNTLQVVPYSFTVTTTCGKTFPASGSITVPANTYTGQATLATESSVIAGLNLQASLYASGQIPVMQSLLAIEYSRLYCLKGGRLQ